MHMFKKFAVLAAAVFALSAVGVASASAAEFTSTGEGELVGTQTSNQEFTASPSSPPVICEKAATKGQVELLAATSQAVHVVYSMCSVDLPIIGEVPVNDITAEYNLLANGEVEIMNNIQIVVAGICSTTVGPQTVGTVSYDNAPEGKIEETSEVSGIHSTSTFPCPSGDEGTYEGTNLVELPGETLTFDK